MTSTPLPEQGGFNEKLTEILSNFWHYQNDHGKDRGTTFDEAEAAIRTLVLEEIIGEDLPLKFKNSKGFCNLCADSDCCPHHYEDELRAEQRKKLGGSDGTK